MPSWAHAKETRFCISPGWSIANYLASFRESYTSGVGLSGTQIPNPEHEAGRSSKGTTHQQSGWLQAACLHSCRSGCLPSPEIHRWDPSLGVATGTVPWGFHSEVNDETPNFIRSCIPQWHMTKAGIVYKVYCQSYPLHLGADILRTAGYMLLLQFPSDVWHGTLHLYINSATANVIIASVAFSVWHHTTVPDVKPCAA